MTEEKRETARRGNTDRRTEHRRTVHRRKSNNLLEELHTIYVNVKCNII